MQNKPGVQYAGLALSGALAGLAGVFLSMGYVSFFVRDMTAGRGFIALAAVFLGGLPPGASSSPPSASARRKPWPYSSARSTCRPSWFRRSRTP
ncbi:ABC transporter permease subunit [Streptomyces muensis]|uniref:Uncharacterized protein n=1 Tax=Streptomyces muensis TaxID=1077944 RepID=A0A9X1PSW7_STRM4|nr:hypothetical protein [Streptomyces muensis]MCF1592892.1 hypothetical protein [Streptomyces muensis]